MLVHKKNKQKEGFNMKKIKLMKMLMCVCTVVVLVGCANNSNYDKDKEAPQTQIQEQENKVENQKTEETHEDLAETNVETATELEPETEKITDLYGPVEVSQLDYDSFQSRMTDEEWEGFQQYFPVLKENAKFHYADFGVELNRNGESLKEDEYHLFNSYISDEVMDIDHFAEMWSDDVWKIEDIRVLDLDGDGIQELIIQWTPVGEILVLHREKDEFYAWEATYRAFEGLQTNGVYIGSGGAGANRWKRIQFDNGNWLEETLFEEDWGKYYVNGEPVDEDTFLKQVDFYETDEVTRYEPKQNTVGIAKVYNASENGVLKTYYEMEDGTWECEGTSYPFRLVLSGRTPTAVMDSCFVVLTDNEKLTFEEVSTSLYSSSMEYINKVMKGSVIVEWN